MVTKGSRNCLLCSEESLGLSKVTQLGGSGPEAGSLGRAGVRNTGPRRYPGGSGPPSLVLRASACCHGGPANTGPVPQSFPPPHHRLSGLGCVPSPLSPHDQPLWPPSPSQRSSHRGLPHAAAAPSSAPWPWLFPPQPGRLFPEWLPPSAPSSLGSNTTS